MIKAASLFYAIVISLIIAIVSSSLILYSYLTRIEFDNLKINQNLELNVMSGLQLLMGSQSLVEPNTSKTIDLFGNKTDSVLLIRKSWGAHEVIISKAFLGNRSVQKIAEIGYYPDTTNSYSLYLADGDSPLALCGSTLIKGTAYLPKAGVKVAYIEGQNFVGKQLVQGPIKTSKPQLPEFNNLLNDDIQAMLSGHFGKIDDSTIVCEREFPKDSLKNSFEHATLHLTGSGSFVLGNCYYFGNIIVTTDKQITIRASAVLNNILVCAPKVIVESGFRGNIQIFAADTILIETGVTLYYPSVLGVVVNERSSRSPVIIMNDKDTIGGNVFVYKMGNQEKIPGIIIHNGAVIQGLVYSNGYVDLKGTIYGSLMCNKIVLSTPSGFYENHLLNAVIDASRLSPYFVGINLVKESQEKKIAKWLD